MVITPEERARAVVRAVLSAYFDGASFRNVPPRCIAALSRFDLEYGNKKIEAELDAARVEVQRFTEENASIVDEIVDAAVSEAMDQEKRRRDK